MRRLLVILLLLAFVTPAALAQAQTGGKKREKYHRKGAKRGTFHLTQYKSQGHADEFARGGNHRGFLSRLFRKDRPAWVYKSSGSVRSHHRENRFLFFRDRSKGRLENDETQARQNNDRAKRRDHGNRSFRFRKYKRK